MAEVLKSIYAQAMYELCEEQGCCAEAFEELETISAIMSDNEELVLLLRSPLIGMEEKKQVLQSVFGGKVLDIVFDFLCLVTEKGRAGFITEICGEFKQIYFDKNNILEVSVITAQPLSERLEKKLADKLEKTLGKKINIRKSVDTSLIGGIIVRYDNSELDSSVRGRLDKLREQIDSVIA